MRSAAHLCANSGKKDDALAMTALKSINPLGGVGEREKKRSPSFSSRGEIAHLHSKRKGLLDRWGERNRSVRKRSEEATS